MNVTKLEQRFNSQLHQIELFFHDIHQSFRQRKPIDQNLSRMFRENSKLGSKDRKLVSNSIFGFFRWYGWLHRLIEINLSQALLLGYLLDENPGYPIIEYWQNKSGLPEILFQRLTGGGPQENHVERKQEIIASLFGNIAINELFPEYFAPFIENKEIVRALQQRPPIWVRLTTTPSPELFSFFKEKKVDYAYHEKFPYSLQIHSPVNFNEIPLFREGGMQIQDISSQGIGLTCSPREGESWWDVCAGAGGKTLHLLDLINGQGEVVATDIRENSLWNLSKRTKDSKQSKLSVLHWDGQNLPFGKREFDGILVDAPCSGSGTWRRNPALRWYYQLDDIQGFADQQLQILTLASKQVRRGGKLVFSTCSLFPQEQNQVVEKFIDKNSEFSLLQDANPLTGEVDNGFHHFGPPSLDGDFMFSATLVRKS